MFGLRVAGVSRGSPSTDLVTSEIMGLSTSTKRLYNIHIDF
jgi:hypothetical protein